jgi:hypothetical protein
LRGGEGQHAVADVGVAVLVIRIGVVAVVRVDPPAVTEADEHVAERAADGVVMPAAGEYRLMPGIVSKERDLGERECEQGRRDELEPRVPDHDDRDHDRSKEAQRDHTADAVADKLAVEQTGIAHRLHQFTEVADVAAFMRVSASARCTIVAGPEHGIRVDRALPAALAQTLRTLSACGPFGPCVVSYSTRWLSSRLL